jgi:hypothetical protein
MPDWSHTPPPVPSDFQYRLIRIPAATKLRAIILATRLTGCRTHFFKGHTTPCEEGKCEACDAGLYWRWHAYIPCICAPGGEKIILELTAQAAEQLSPALAEYRTLRGIEFIAERPARRPNGRIRITCAPGLRPENSLPACPDVATTMLHIWGLDDATVAKSPGKLASTRLSLHHGNGEELTQNLGTLP